MEIRGERLLEVVVLMDLMELMATGADGSDGSPIGISVSDASSIQCTSPVGGLVFEVFLDTDLDGIKDVGETVLNTTVKCTDYAIYLAQMVLLSS